MCKALGLILRTEEGGGGKKRGEGRNKDRGRERGRKGKRKER
jgi:hypothetical protein